MTDESIEAVIDAINAGGYEDWIFLWEIADSAKAAKVWPERAMKNGRMSCGYDFVLIFDENEQCIAANLEMSDGDLHIFVKPEHRRKGVATNALQNVVLPWIFFKDPYRIRQKVTYREDYVERLLVRIGFEICDEQNAVISKGDCVLREFKSESRMQINLERKEAMRQEIESVVNVLYKVKSEINGRFSNKFAINFETEISKLSDLARSLKVEWDKYSKEL